MKKLIFCFLMALFIIGACGTRIENKIDQNGTPPEAPAYTLIAAPTAAPTPISYTIVPKPTEVPTLHVSNGFTADYEIKDNKFTLVDYSYDQPIVHYYIGIRTEETPPYGEAVIYTHYHEGIRPVADGGYLPVQLFMLSSDIRGILGEYRVFPFSNAKPPVTQETLDFISSIFRVYINDKQVYCELKGYMTQGIEYYGMVFPIDDLDADGINTFRMELGFKEDLITAFSKPGQDDQISYEGNRDVNNPLRYVEGSINSIEPNPDGTVIIKLTSVSNYNKEYHTPASDPDWPFNVGYEFAFVLKRLPEFQIEIGDIVVLCTSLMLAPNHPSLFRGAVVMYKKTDDGYFDSKEQMVEMPPVCYTDEDIFK